MTFDTLADYLLKKALFTNEDLVLIKSYAVMKRVTKRDFIFKTGEICKHMIFVSKGLLRLFRVDDNGNDYIIRFASETSWMSERESYLTGQPSNYSIEAIENSEVLIWKKEDFRYLLDQIPALKVVMKSLLEKNQIATQHRVFTSMSSSAEEKYRQFIETQPGIFNRLPLHMVASYLGLSRKTLSRIRNTS